MNINASPLLPPDPAGGQSPPERLSGQERLAEQDAAALVIMRRVRARLVTDHPFFGDLALRLDLKVDRTCRDMWCDGKTLGFNPLYAGALREEKLAGAQAHEVLHILLGHHVRRRRREPSLWNKACDMAVNSILVQAGFSLPDGFFFDAAFAGCSVDEIYETLLSRMLKAQEQQGKAARPKPRISPQSGQSPDPVAGSSRNKLGFSAPNDGSGQAREGEEQDRVQQAGRGVQPVPGAKGSGRHKKEAVSARFDGEVRDLPDLEDGEGSEDARERAERETELLLTQAVSRARRMGRLPAGLEREVARVDVARVDWREILQRFLMSCCDNDYTWTVPNRRYLYQDIYMPSRWEMRLQHVVVAIDTSGSVDAPLLSLFLRELENALEAFDRHLTHLTLVYHDSKVQGLQTLSGREFDQIRVPVGGGGTDYRPVPEELVRQGIEPVCLVWFTDLECTRFPEEPDYPVLWVSPDAGGEEPPFGERVAIRG